MARKLVSILKQCNTLMIRPNIFSDLQEIALVRSGYGVMEEEGVTLKLLYNC